MVKFTAVSDGSTPTCVIFGCAAVKSVPVTVLAAILAACILPATPKPPDTITAPVVVDTLESTFVTASVVPSTVDVKLLDVAMLFRPLGCRRYLIISISSLSHKIAHIAIIQLD